jgi:hypothetical protein
MALRVLIVSPPIQKRACRAEFADFYRPPKFMRI